MTDLVASEQYKRFFAHISPAMTTMTQLLRQDRAPAEIMRMPRAQQRRAD